MNPVETKLWAAADAWAEAALKRDLDSMQAALEQAGDIITQHGVVNNSYWKRFWNYAAEAIKDQKAITQETT